MNVIYISVGLCCGKSQLHKEKRSTEEETELLISPSPLWTQRLPEDTNENSQVE